MRGRAYVMIFFFWALLTIITPMLVSWSESLKHPSQSQGNKNGETGARRMMGDVELHLKREEAREIEEEAPSLAPTPEDDTVNQTLKTSSLIIKSKKNHTDLMHHPLMRS